MGKRRCVRGIVIKNDEIFFIHRIKNNEEYYVFPGGGIEYGETDIEGLNRELMEEIGTIVEPVKALYNIEQEDRIEKFILCKYISGDFNDANGPEWTSEEYKSHGSYEQVSIKISELSKYNIVPEKIRIQFFKDLEIDSTLQSFDERNII
ncbi:MAG: NUDIX domain-containing protein [Bacilli bacterium]